MALEEVALAAFGIIASWYLTKGAGGSAGSEERAASEKKADYPYRTPSL